MKFSCKIIFLVQQNEYYWWKSWEHNLLRDWGRERKPNKQIELIILDVLVILSSFHIIDFTIEINFLKNSQKYIVIQKYLSIRIDSNFIKREQKHTQL